MADDNLALDDKKNTGFLSDRVKNFESVIGDVGEFSTEEGMLGTPIPKNLNPINPFQVATTPSLGEGAIVDETVVKPNIIPPKLPQNVIEQEGPAVGAKIKGYFAEDEELTALKDEAKVRNASKDEIDQIAFDYRISKNQEERSVKAAAKRDPLLIDERFRDTSWAIQNRPPEYGEEKFDEFEAALKGREADKKRTKLEDKLAKKKAKMEEKPYGVVLNDTLFTVDSAFNKLNPNKKHTWKFITRPQAEERGGGTYTINDATYKEARELALEMDRTFRNTGKVFYSQEHKELNSKTRRLIESGGDFYEFSKTIQDFAPAEYEMNLKRIQESALGAQLSDYPEVTQGLAALQSRVWTNGIKALPQYLLYAGGPAIAKGLDAMFFPLENIVLETYLQWGNTAIDDETNRFVDQNGESLLPTMYNDNLFYNSNGQNWQTPSGPLVKMTKDDFLDAWENRENANVMVGAVRKTFETSGVILGMLAITGPGSVRFVNSLAVQAEKNLLKRGRAGQVELIKNKKTGVFEVNSKDELYAEMKILLGEQLEQRSIQFKNSLSVRAGNYYKSRQFYFGTQPMSWMKDTAFFVGGAEIALEITERYVTQVWKDDGIIDFKDPAAVALELSSVIAGGLFANKIANTIMQWPFRAYRKGAETVSKTGEFVGDFTSIDILKHSFNRFTSLIQKDGISIPGVTKDTAKRMRVLGTRLNEIGEKNPAFLRSMQEAWDGTRNMYYLMRVPRDLTNDQPMISENEFFTRKDELIGNMSYLESLGGKSLFSKDASAMTMGMYFDNKTLRLAEEQLAIEGKALMGSGSALKADKGFKFIAEAYALRKEGQAYEKEIRQHLNAIADIPEGIQIQQLNALALQMEETLRNSMAESASFKVLIDNSVRFQVGLLLGQVELFADTHTKLLSILQNYPELMLSDVEKGLATDAAAKIALAKTSSVIADKTLTQFRERLISIDNYMPKEIKGYGTLGTAIKSGNASAANEISDLSQTVATTTIARTDDFLYTTYSGLYTKALGSIPEGMRSMDILDLAFSVNEISRTNGPTYVTEFMNYMKNIMEPIFEPQLIKEYKQIASELPADSETGKKITWQQVKSDTEKDIIEERTNSTIPMVGNVSQLDQIEYLQNYQGSQFSFKIPYTEVHEIRKTANAMSFKKSSSGDRASSDSLTSIKNAADDAMAGHEQMLTDNGYDTVVTALNEAKALYGPNYAERVKQSTFLREIDSYQKLEKHVDKNKIVDGKLILETVNTDTNLPMLKSYSSAGKYPSGRLISSDNNKIFDRMFRDMSATDIVNEMKIMFGEPLPLKVVNNKSMQEYAYPKEGDPLYATFKTFVKYIDNYFAAKNASILDNLEAQGKLSFSKKVENAKTEADWQEIESTITPDYFVGEADSKEIRELADKIKNVHRISSELSSKEGDAIGNIGKNFYDNYIAWTGSDNKAAKATNIVLKEQTKMIDKRLAQSAEIISDTTFVINKAKAEMMNWNTIVNAESFLDQVIQSQITNKEGVVISPWLENVKKNWLASGKKLKDFNTIAASLMAQGVDDKFAHMSGGFRWANKAVNTAKKGKLIKRQLRDSIFKKTKTYGENILKRKKGESSTKLELDKQVDGIGLYNYLDAHKGVLSTYMNKSMTKLNLIAKISTVNQAPTSDGTKVNPVTQGLPHIDWPMAQSRMFAVKSGRASITYPLTEVAGILIKNKEAQSVGNLLLAGEEILDPLARILLTGKTSRYQVKPNWGAYVYSEGILRGSEIYKAFVESENETDTFQEQLDQLFETFPKLDPKVMFPTDIGKDYTHSGKYGRMTINESGKMVFQQRDNYIDMLHKSFNDGLREEESETLKEWIKRATQK